MPFGDTIQKAHRYLMATYRRAPVVFVKGRGCRVYDEEGREYLDFVAGLGVNNLGHCHHAVTVAIQKQAQRLLHTSNLYYTQPQVELARLLVEHSFADQVFFCNSGAEANEAAIKLARRYGWERGGGRYEIITTHRSFHGRTLATLTATGQEKVRKGFDPLVPGFVQVPYNDVKAVEAAITPKTIAVMVEPIQGEGGVIVPDPAYLRELRRLCDARGLLLILDEVQTGLGRTGTLFAYQGTGIEPDLLTLAKALGGGLPIGALLARREVAEVFTPGSHASTFGGNPVACAAGVQVLEALLEDGGLLLDHCRRMGHRLMAGLQALQKQYPNLIREVRGWGLMIGMELTREGGSIVEDCLQEGVLINCTAERVLRFLPPLIVQEDEIDRVLDVLGWVLPRHLPGEGV